MRRIRRSIMLVVFLLVISSAIVAQASEAAGPPPHRGEGAATVSGYEVTGVHFLLAEEPGCLLLVEFDLDYSADQVQVSVDSYGKRLFSCENIRGNHWHCPLGGVKVGGLREIRVVAVGG